MPAMISPKNQTAIERELAARGVDEDTIEWGLEKIDRAARRFVDAKSRPSRRRFGPIILAKQIEKVKSLSGAAQVKAVRVAKDMGLDSEAIDVLARSKRAQTLVEHARDAQVLMRLNPQYFEQVAKRTCLKTDMFQVTCMGVWLAAGGEVRFSINDKNDGGPFGRFLTAAFFDAYTAAGVRSKHPI